MSGFCKIHFEKRKHFWISLQEDRFYAFFQEECFRFIFKMRKKDFFSKTRWFSFIEDKLQLSFQTNMSLFGQHLAHKRDILSKRPCMELLNVGQVVTTLQLGPINFSLTLSVRSCQLLQLALICSFHIHLHAYMSFHHLRMHLQKSCLAALFPW